MSEQHKKQEDFDVLEQELNLHEIILFNDDVNTFEHVIESLVDVCNHSSVQAEQCAFLVHYKGKCAVKTGEYDELKPRCTRLLNLGLSAEIV
ncbi:ATP-dependent Clp protease adaptor ClpS [Aureibaculum algae]|uniref:ATP-dependent Clp protease adaptor ClpS n=2 Tax=Aureibaculum TaxID=2706948 RepID=A0A5B7TZD6_9FLAO|nr:MULTISPECIES: ATP-dependent Clp protease adaptor ClpS [Aureibaculum]MBJ2176237.1 ATP-dependent Clp protease adaptor ClpS [Aureibaculum flavum]QCX40556.1 ATP-dependent Clp protease adaptor ClpS [Aureibaculum algae]